MIPKSRSIAPSVLLAWLAMGAAVPAASAALAPHYERLREFAEAWAMAGEAAQKLYRHGPIDRIERAEDGNYRIRAGRCFVPVIVRQVPSEYPQNRIVLGAPITYEAALGEVRCP